MKKVFVIIFVSMLIVFSAINIVKPAKGFSDTENRYLASMPTFSLEGLLDGSFGEDFEKHVTDQIMFRDFFVFLKSNVEKLSGKTENNNVYFADDGYLIELPPEYNAERLEKNIDAINNLAYKYNVTFSLVPTAYEILNDKLPPYAYTDIQKRIINFCKDNLKNVNFIDSSTTLNENKNEYIYYRTDHHQTMHGSFLVYTDILKGMGKVPCKSEDFNIEVMADDFYGTTWSKTPVNIQADEIIKYTPKFDVSYKTEYMDNGKTIHSLYVDNNLKIKDKYTYYLGGNNSVVNIKTSVKNGEKLAVIKDSYAHSIIPFLANHYEEIYVVDLRYYSYNVFEFLNEREIKDVLVLYNVTNFSQDNNLIKITAYKK